MDLAIEISRMKRILTFLGYYPLRSKCNIKTYLLYTAMILMIINMAFYVIYNWEDVTLRLNGVRSIANYSLIGLYSLVFSFKRKDMIKLLDAIDSYPYGFPYCSTQVRHNMLQSTVEQMARLSHVWYKAIIACMIIGINTPLLSLTITIFTSNTKDIDITKILLLFPFYFPEGHVNLVMYFLGYSMQTMILLASGFYGYFSIGTSFMSMQTIEGELKLLRLSVESIDEIILNDKITLSSTKNRERENYTLLFGIRSFTEYFIQHHQYIYRKADDVNKGIQWFAFLANFGVSIYVCLEISNVVKTDMTILKMQQIFFSLLWVYNIYCYDYFGEKIETEDEHLRTALYQCEWVEKGPWFKKSLHMIMTRTNRPIQMKPAGLFQLNLKNFALCMNAAYSYYNIINNVNSS